MLRHLTWAPFGQIVPSVGSKWVIMRRPGSEFKQELLFSFRGQAFADAEKCTEAFAKCFSEVQRKTRALIRGRADEPKGLVPEGHQLSSWTR